MTLNPFYGTGLLQCSLKTSGNIGFPIYSKKYAKTSRQ